jgi:hypothetical protein
MAMFKDKKKSISFQKKCQEGFLSLESNAKTILGPAEKNWIYLVDQRVSYLDIYFVHFLFTLLGT